MKANKIRKKYLEFFQSCDHVILSSASLIPENDPTTLFTGSGMQSMIPYLLGEKHPSGKRLADSQKCFRAQDIDEVGDNRHTTFFEMLGNWSLGDYFKREQISWMFEFLTKEIGLDPKRIYISVFRGKESIGIPKDEQSVKIWQEQFAKDGLDAKAVDQAEDKGMRGGRIFYYDEKKNWWSRAGVTGDMPVGEPGGPDSEMFWDFGEELKIHENSAYKDQPCHPNCDCGRFMEIGNNVFMQYRKTEGGFEPLPHNNVDFGGGLERLLAAVSDTPDIFKIDIFQPAIGELEKLSGKKYGESDSVNVSFRVICDHLRAAVFLVNDGALPSNKDQGYFTRRLIRRAIRYANNTGIKGSFSRNIVRSFIETYAEPYPYLRENKEVIIGEIIKEETKFLATLEKGLKEFERMSFDKKISGKEAFDLFQSYGFPLEMTEELAKENNLEIDIAGFNEEFAKHQEVSRQGAEKKFKGGLADAQAETCKLHTATHLLQAALRQVLGDHVEQKGSNITAERLRFDFSHPDKMTPEQLKSVEELVNQWIERDLEVLCEEVSYDQAKQKGAMGLFEDKYGEIVKVYTIPEVSCELCGGPHTNRTGELGRFKIKKEESSSAGIRRIKAVLE